MYARRIQLTNYGPIDELDITFPFEGDAPKPVVLVGENGSGKSILLSHIVNGLVAAKGVAFPKASEVETGSVYKLRNNSYIKTGRRYYYGRVDFSDGLYVREMRYINLKQETETNPAELLEPDTQELWNKMKPGTNDSYDSNIRINNETVLKSVFAKNCILYFPSNRFEEPAWLNERNLIAKAEYMDMKQIQGETNRRVISYSPLHDNQNWLFEVIYDRAAFEMRIANLPLSAESGGRSAPLFAGYSGDATSVYDVALQIVQSITRIKGARFGIGTRRNRVVSIQAGSELVVPNIFQLSSGETTLMNLFLSILREFDLCDTPFSSTVDVRGIVVVDEIDLHLHTDLQYNVLPVLIKMFPNVQFVITTHSPLFVLGMNGAYGEDGFALYRLPQGRQINPEGFSEFGDAYQSLTTTRRYLDDMRAAIETTRKPLVCMEGTTDLQYVQRASELLDRGVALGQINLKEGNGSGNLKNIWKLVTRPLHTMLPQKVVLLHDCESPSPNDKKGNWFRHKIPMRHNHPIKIGIENLFSVTTLQKARNHRAEFIDVVAEHTATERGRSHTVPEQWSVNDDEKKNLCDWLCANGTSEDFQYFGVVFDLLENLLNLGPAATKPILVEEVGVGDDLDADLTKPVDNS